MNTIIKKIDNLNIDQSIIKEAAGILQKGGLVAFPTETVYGLGANGLSEGACRKIYEAKGRPSDNPLILHIGDINQLSQIAEEVTPLAQNLIDEFWPGPMTLILKKKACVPDSVTGGLDTVGVRFPSNEIAKALIKAANFPIAAPSANSSGKPSTTSAAHVKEDLLGKVEMIIDGGSTDFGLESTIINATGNVAVVLRPGAITFEMVKDLLGAAEIDPAILNQPEGDFVPKAPGMKYKHYAPKAQVILVEGAKDTEVISYINRMAKEQAKNKLKVGVLSTDETRKSYKAEIVLSLGSRKNQVEIGVNLFDCLRRFDTFGADIVYSEVFNETGEGLAIMNRLKKAAGYHLVKV